MHNLRFIPATFLKTTFWAMVTVAKTLFWDVRFGFLPNHHSACNLFLGAESSQFRKRHKGLTLVSTQCIVHRTRVYFLFHTAENILCCSRCSYSVHGRRGRRERGGLGRRTGLLVRGHCLYWPRYIRCSGLSWYCLLPGIEVKLKTRQRIRWRSCWWCRHLPNVKRGSATSRWRAASRSTTHSINKDQGRKLSIKASL